MFYKLKYNCTHQSELLKWFSDTNRSRVVGSQSSALFGGKTESVHTVNVGSKILFAHDYSKYGRSKMDQDVGL